MVHVVGCNTSDLHTQLRARHPAPPHPLLCTPLLYCTHRRLGARPCRGWAVSWLRHARYVNRFNGAACAGDGAPARAAAFTGCVPCAGPLPLHNFPRVRISLRPRLVCGIPGLPLLRFRGRALPRRTRIRGRNRLLAPRAPPCARSADAAARPASVYLRSRRPRCVDEGPALGGMCGGGGVVGEGAVVERLLLTAASFPFGPFG